MFKIFVEKIKLLFASILLSATALMTAVLFLLGPCYEGCTTASIWNMILEQAPFSYLFVLLLSMAVIQFLVAIYILIFAFISKISLSETKIIVISVIAAPLAVFWMTNLYFDFGDALFIFIGYVCMYALLVHEYRIKKRARDTIVSESKK